MCNEFAVYLGAQINKMLLQEKEILEQLRQLEREFSEKKCMAFMLTGSSDVVFLMSVRSLILSDYITKILLTYKSYLL